MFIFNKHDTEVSLSILKIFYSCFYLIMLTLRERYLSAISCDYTLLSYIHKCTWVIKENYVHVICKNRNYFQPIIVETKRDFI